MSTAQDVTVKGTLVLLPNSLGGPISEIVTSQLTASVQKLNGIIAESERAARRFLNAFQGLKAPPGRFPLAIFDEHTPLKDLDWLLEPLLQGQTWGYLSDAGLPCFADPGAQLVRRAREHGLIVEVVAGPSAPLLALLLTGLPTTPTHFHGYAPRDPEGRARWLAGRAKQEGTHVLVEAPYRNEALWKALSQELPPGTPIAVAVDLTLPTQQVWVGAAPTEWCPPQLSDRPAVFLFHISRDALDAQPPRREEGGRGRSGESTSNRGRAGPPSRGGRGGRSPRR